MSQHLSNYNYPSANVNVNVEGGGSGGGAVGTQDPANLFSRFLLMDKFSDFSAIPKKIVADNGMYNLYIPITNTLANPNWHLFRRRLFLNTENGTAGTGNGQRKFIPIARPTPEHKAYIHSITYTAYDFNELLPFISVDDINSRIVIDMFATGVHGLRINSSPMVDANIWNYVTSELITTAHYPIYRLDTKARQQELQVMNLLGQSAPRSSIRGGMLPGDFFHNNFWLSLKGYKFAGTPNFDSPGETYTNIWETPTDNNSYNIENDLTAGDNSQVSDMILPNISNEMDIEIPEDIEWIAVDVGGAGWRHGAFDSDKSVLKPVAKILPNAANNYITYVQMPVKVQIDIRYWKEPDIINLGGGAS